MQSNVTNVASSITVLVEANAFAMFSNQHGSNVN